MDEHIGKLIEYTEMILTDLTGMMAVIEAMKAELEAMESEQPIIINADEVSKGIQSFIKSSGSRTMHGGNNGR